MRISRTYVMRTIAAGSPIVLGVVLGLAITLSSPLRPEPGWNVWAALAVSLTTASGVVFVYGIRRWEDLRQVSEVRARDVSVRMAAIILFAVLALAGQTAVVGSSGTWRGPTLVALTLTGGTPALSAMLGIGVAAPLDPSSIPPTGIQIDELVALRRLLERLIVAVGALVALSALSLGAAITAASDESADTNRSALQQEAAIVFGAAGSLLVGLAYVPANSSLRRRGLELRDRLFPVHKADDPTAALGRAEQRRRLEELLGVTESSLSGLRNGLIVLGPLLSTAIGVFLVG